MVYKLCCLLSFFFKDDQTSYAVGKENEFWERIYGSSSSYLKL